MRRFAAWAVLVIGLGCTAAAWRLAVDDAIAQRRITFDRHVRLVTAAVHARFDAYETVLRAAVGIALRPREVRRAEWRRLATDLALPTRFPDLEVLAFAELVPAAALESHASAMRAEGFPDYRPRPEGPRDEYALLDYLEPLDARSRSALGFDILSEPRRRDAAHRARDTGRPALTERLHLAQDDPRSPPSFFVIYHPVYGHLADAPSIEDRRAALRGFVTAAFRLPELMAGILSPAEPAVHMVIRDGSGSGPASILYQRPSTVDGVYEPRFRSVTTIDCAGRTWTLDFESRRPFESGVYGTGIAVVLLGLAATGVLSGLARTQSTAERSATRAVGLVSAQLHQREARLRAIVDAEPECVKVVSLDDELLEMNPAGLAMIEADDLKQVAGMRVETLVHEADRAVYRGLHERVVAGGTGTATFRIVGLRGTTRWVESIAVPLREPGGGVGSILSVTRDVTERKRAEEKLEAVFRAVPDLFFVVGRDDVIVDFRGGAEGDLYAPPAQLLGRRMTEVLPPDVARQLEDRVAAVRATGQPTTLAYRLPMPRGDEDFEGRILPLGTGDVLVVARNITAFMQSQRALEASEERYRRLVETATEGIWLLDAEDRTAFVNTGMARMLGYDVSEMLGRSVFDFMDDEGRAAVAPILERRRRGIAERHDVKLRRQDGRALWVMVSARPIFENGRYAGTLGMVTDVTERKDLEHRLRQAQKMEALGTLAGGIAHDFNNILASIVGYAELARLGLENDPARRSDLDNVLEAGRRAKGLVEQVLAFSQAREGEEALPLDPAPVVADAVKLVRIALPSSIVIETRVAPDLPSIVAAESEIHQLVLNLANNGAQAMPDRTGRLRIALDVVVRDDVPPDVPLASPAARWLRLRVEDDGTGIDAATLERIFEPFFTTKAPGTGTGLGLAVAHGIVTRHGGAIGVRSRPGEGSIFDVYLPAHDGAAPAAAAEPPAPPAGHGEHVLFVDDDAPIAELGGRMLRTLGYRVTALTDPAEALALVRRDPGAFDVVVADVTMPTLTGTELARELLRLRADLPIVLTTGYGGGVTPAAARELGARGLLAKPNTLAALGRAVHDALAGAA